MQQPHFSKDFLKIYEGKTKIVLVIFILVKLTQVNQEGSGIYD
jgi:hypothetical protein